jgi:hypothetical protein
MRRALIPLAAVACALVIAGCGDDDSSSDTVLTPTSGTPQTTSKADFLSDGDAICAEVNAAIGTLQSTSVSDTSSLVGQEADLYEGMVQRLEGLGRPSDDEGLDDVFDAGNALVDAKRDAELAAQRGDDAALAEAESDASSALAKFQQAAESYGFSECGQSPEAPTVTGTATTTVPVAPAPAPTVVPTTPVVPAPATPAPPTGGAGQGGETGGGTGGGTEGGTGGTGGTGGIGPG